MPMLYVVSLKCDPGNATLRGTPLRLAPYYDLAAAQQAVAWQVTGGFKGKDYVIATVDTDLPGVMRAEDGRPVLIDNDVWTPEAFARFIIHCWG